MSLVMQKNFKAFEDERGSLVPIEFKHLPFRPKRMFYVYGVPEGIERGGHSHYETRQLLICIKGAIKVTLVDKQNTTYAKILEKNESILVENLIWDSQTFLINGSMLLVLCSTVYDANDYIYDWDEFTGITDRKMPLL